MTQSNSRPQSLDRERPPDSRQHLRVLGWEHPRCMGPLRAAAVEWQRQGRGQLEISSRSLESFGDQPLEELAGAHDVLVIDHPFCGTAARSGCLTPLEELVDSSTLAQIAADAVGPSQQSYVYDDRTWAFAGDAACQVSAYLAGPEDSGEDPQDWPGALSLMKDLGRRAGLPLFPAHAISSLLTLWAGAGHLRMNRDQLADPERGEEQVEWLIDMHRTGHPDSTRWEPPEALATLASGTIEYIPLTYGYVNYARGQNKAPADSGEATTATEKHVRFGDIPGVRGSVLGGAGLAVSSSSTAKTDAAAFAAWFCSASVQGSIVAPAGGQPASATCWSDETIDQAADRFYSSTRSTIEHAWVRPRESWWPAFQLKAGQALTRALESHVSARGIVQQLGSIYDQIALRSGASS